MKVVRAMAKGYTVEEFSLAVNEAMKEFQQSVDYDVIYVTQKVANEAAQNVKRNIKSSGIRGTGKYRRSITSRQIKDSPLSKKSVVYAKAPSYRLTHLLEHGHAKVNGGRTRAFEHWGPAEKQAIDDFISELREAIES